MEKTVEFNGILVSSDGRFFKDGKELKIYDGIYKKIQIYVNGKIKNFNVHRVMAQCFVPNPENKEQVNHIDGNKHNNSIENLEWVTRSENTLHSYRIGLQKGKGCKKPIVCLETGTKIPSLTEASRITGISISYLSNMLIGKRNNKTTLSYENSNAATD